MCWTTFEKPIRKIAKEDIPVFKIVRKDLRAYYRDFEYILGELHCSRLALPITEYCREETYYRIEKGLHSYSKECEITLTDLYMIIRAKCERGMIADYRRDIGQKIECIIPKGSMYYENRKGEFVSNRIIALRYGEM